MSKNKSLKGSLIHTVWRDRDLLQDLCAVGEEGGHWTRGGTDSRSDPVMMELASTPSPELSIDRVGKCPGCPRIVIRRI